jgi:hypothetical protein
MKFLAFFCWTVAILWTVTTLHASYTTWAGLDPIPLEAHLIATFVSWAMIVLPAFLIGAFFNSRAKS